MKKRLFSILMMFFLAFTITLVGCGEKGLENNPPLEATVVSNGGMSVIKGDYLYFVNGYVDETTLTKDDNKMGEVTKGAIYRTKLENNEISKDVDGFLTNYDRVVSKVVGFSNGGFEIIDNYIFYATPFMKIKNSDETATIQTNRVEFHRVDIDGTNDEVIFVSEDTPTNWTIYKIGNTPYLVVVEDAGIVSINGKDGKEVGRVTDATSSAILKQTDYVYSDTRDNFNELNIIYTKDIANSEDEENAVCAFNISSGESTELVSGDSRHYTIQHVTKNTVYYSFTTVSKKTACLYKRDIITTWKKATETILTEREYTNYLYVDHGTDRFIATADSMIWLLEAGEEAKMLISTEKTIVAVYGDYAYYVDSDQLYRVNMLDGTHELESSYEEGKNSIITNSNFIDFDNRRIYIYNLYTAENGEENYYLNYFDEDFEDSGIKQRFVGVFESDDIPEKPEQPEPEYEGDEVEYIPHVD